MKLKYCIVFVGLSGVGVLSGCNVGMQPEGPDVAQVKAREASLPPDQQIAMIKDAPMPAAQKAAKIAEIKSKYGIK
jgi:hypothetical protein